MKIDNIQQLLEHINTEKEAEELVDYINNLQIENTRLKEQIIKAITYIQEDLCCDYGDYCNNSAKDLLQILGDKENG